MDTNSAGAGTDSPCRYELVFMPLHQGRSFAFPCSEEGVVDLDHLAEPALNNYPLEAGGVSGSWVYDLSATGVTLHVTPVPEPTTTILLLCGLVGVGALAAQKRRLQDRARLELWKSPLSA
jgi:hypothetical protein